MAVLGSGSRGNCTLLTCHLPQQSPRHLLLDAGLSPRQTNLRLARFGLSLGDIELILLTHLDRDHFGTTWPNACKKNNIQIHCSRKHYRRSSARLEMGSLMEAFDGPFALFDHLEVETVNFAHDALGSVGYVIDAGSARIGFATDLGCVPSTLYERFVSLDLLAIESNYDYEMQIDSGRPRYLTDRIMGGRGHLSNVQALEAIERVAARSVLQHIVLLHLSQDCNCPKLLSAFYQSTAPHLADRLHLSEQQSATSLIQVMASQQPRPTPATSLRPAQPMLF